MKHMKQNYFLGINSKSFHRVSYIEWGKKNSQPIICVHGLSRNAHDFDLLARKLVDIKKFVVCPDIVGRGDSDWLLDPKDYTYPLYLSDMTALIARLNVNSVGWIGTSMGGMLGMVLAAFAKSPVKYLILNDIGPFIPAEGLNRIKSYRNRVHTLKFDTLEHANQYFRENYTSFGLSSDEEWEHFTLYSTREGPDGKYILRTDPAVNIPSSMGKVSDIDLWYVWREIKCPVLVIRGRESDLLTAETVTKMKETHSNCESIEVANAGHAPALVDPETVGYILQWIKKQS